MSHVRPERPSELPENPDELARLRWLLATLWGNNESAMARALGLSQPTIWRTFSGKSAPGRALLSALAGHPKVNPAWLMTGKGEPLLAAQQDGGDNDWHLPIAARPLPRAPVADAASLTGEMFSVPRAFHRRTRYWLKIHPRDPVTKDPSQKVAAGDLLLMETDTGSWTQPEDVDDRLCVVRMPDRRNGEERLKLARVSYAPVSPEEAASFLADDFEPLVPLSSTERIITIREKSGGKLQATQHRVQKGGSKPVSHARMGAHPRKISPDDIVSVCVLLVRR